ncbi:MAG: archaeosortase/exosortase family protein [Nanoarchaeota archaeon]|nr:archaeosortase/exosortase family protein [Nanoarchaeota archaeon]
MVILFAIFNRNTLLSYNNIPPITQRIFSVLMSFSSFFLYYYFRFSLAYTNKNFPWLFVVSGFFYLLGVVGIALAIFGFRLFQKTYNSLLIFSFITFFFYIITQILWQLWDFLAFNVARIVYLFLSLFSSTTVLKLGQGDPTLGLSGFSVIIGPPCSGIESLSMFIGLFVLLIVYEQDNLNWKRTGIVFILGLMGTYLINIFRVATLLLIGTRYPDFALGIFHSQAGWILFSGFILLLLYFGYQWMKKEKPNYKSNYKIK